MWIKVLSFGVCFKSVASYCNPQYLIRTSPLSIPCAWNSRIWHFHSNNTLLPWRNIWNLVFATSRPELMKMTCQFRRFLARTFRPVANRCSHPRGYRDCLIETAREAATIWYKGYHYELNRYEKFSWAFVLVSQDWPIWTPSQLSVCSHTPLFTIQLFLDFRKKNSDVAPHFLSAHDSTSNLAESRYPPIRFALSSD